ncbi:Carnitine O-acetyltransferase mitochondrial [Ancistrocladus abbreviatus]
MGIEKNFEGLWRVGLTSLIRRKQVDSVNVRKDGERNQLAKTLSVVDLIAIGVGSTIGAGVYILVGTVARENTGPALTIAFLIAGIAAALSAFCYAELSCRCPSAGSAYHYSYICIGEGVAWLIGWALILEYTIGGSAVARGISPNLAFYFGGVDKLPALLARHTIFGIVVDPCAAVLVFFVTTLLCMGIKQSALVQTLVTTVNVCAMVFVIIAGGYLAFKTGWVGYHLSQGYFPYGFNGVIAGSATVFFSYIGFDSVASTAEEVKNPQRDLPFGIGFSLSICCILYMLVSCVIVGLVPYDKMDVDTPISAAFADYGMEWAVLVVTTGAVMALCASLMGSLLPQPRILMAMARDGLLPPFFSDINKRTQVPLKSTVATGILAAVLAFCMDVSQLAGMVSVGTLLAFTVVSVSVLVLRYVPPEVVPVPPFIRQSVSAISGSTHNIQETDEDVLTVPMSDHQYLLEDGELDAELIKETALDKRKEHRRRTIAAWNIGFICIGVLIFASASAANLSSFSRITLCGVGGVIWLLGLIVLTCIGQDVGQHTFGHTGGFTCPFVPFLPAASILINTYLLINLGASTWIRVSIWLLIGVLIYLVYGCTHSSLLGAAYVPAPHATEVSCSSSDSST